MEDWDWINIVKWREDKNEDLNTSDSRGSYTCYIIQRHKPNVGQIYIKVEKYANIWSTNKVCILGEKIQRFTIKKSVEDIPKGNESMCGAAVRQYMERDDY